ncbi:hypothetical protein [Kitasatospora cineracea]|uniref:hypothetical protein n=1 Tax=Kitasatospora cineracea TaxID=88074 RepID=UPI0033FED6A6
MNGFGGIVPRRFGLPEAQPVTLPANPAVGPVETPTAAPRPEPVPAVPGPLPTRPEQNPPDQDDDRITMTQNGDRNIQAYKLYLHSDFVSRVEVQPTDPELRAAGEDRFVPSRNAKQWQAAQDACRKFGLVVLNASSGTGRRTQALRLLRGLGVRRIEDLVPEWSKVSVQPLPEDKDCGFVLDLSSLPEAPEHRFADDLAAHGRTLRSLGSYLVVLTTPDDWDGELADRTAVFTAWPESPDAKAFVKAELRAAGAEGRVAWLDNPALEEVWSGNPPARESQRLADLVREAADEKELVEKIGEFTNWPSAVDGLLKKGMAEGTAAVLAVRSIVWAGALLDGGQQSSVIHAGDLLLEVFGGKRTPLQVLSQATGSERLKTAEISVDGDRVRHDTSKSGLAMAILRSLWAEFPTELDRIREWTVKVVGERKIPEADARIAARTLCDLAVERRDRSILDALAGLSSNRRSLIVEIFTEAADNPELGRYVQGLLLQWASNSGTADHKIDMVIEICGGAWGRQRPLLALTRLGKVAGRKELGSAQVRQAFQQLATERPEEVRKALRQWLGDPKAWNDEKLRKQVLASFLAVIGSDQGTDLVLADVHDPETRELVVKAWRGLLELEGGESCGLFQLRRWQERFDLDEAERETVQALFAEVLKPSGLREIFDKVLTDENRNVHPFWRETLWRSHENVGPSEETGTP